MNCNPAVILSQTATQLYIQPAPDDPCFADVEVTSPGGTTSAVLELWPSLLATTTGVGGTLVTTLDNGDVGVGVLAFATRQLTTPLPILVPPTWYEFLLDYTGPMFILATGYFFVPQELNISYPIPNDPTLSGVTLYFQAWCQQASTGNVTYSFTNLASVTL